MGRASKIVGNFEQGYIAMGYIIIASSVFSIFMRIKGQKTMFGTLEETERTARLVLGGAYPITVGI